MGRNILRGILSSRLVIALFTLLVVACTDPAVESQNSLLSAKKYITENNLAAAIIELKNALQANPKNAEARYQLGLLNLKTGDYKAADKEFRRALEAGWNEEEAQIGMAKTAVSSHAYQELIDIIEIKDDYSPKSKAELYGLLAIAQAGIKSLDKAKEALETGASYDPRAFHILISSVQLSLIKGDLMAANIKMDEALSAFPDSNEMLLLSAVIALQNEQKVAAIDALSKVLEREPENLTTANGQQARLRLVRIQIFENQLDQAQATLAPLLKSLANNPETNYLGGMLAFRKGNYELAEERLLNVLKVAPDHTQTQLLFGTVSFQMKNYEQAAEYISRYVSANPDNLGARKLLGRTYMILGERDKAQKTLEPALDSATDDTELLALVGLNDIRGGHMLSGIESLKKAIATAPENKGLRQQLAQAYIASGNEEQAIEELNTILQEGGKKGKTKILLILAYLKSNQPEKAIDSAMRILAENPGNPVAMTLVGNVLMVTGDKIKARGYFEDALSNNPNLSQASLSMARLEEAEGNIAKAITIYKGLADSQPNSIIPLLALARLAKRQENEMEFIAWLEQARTLAPQHLPLRQALAEAYLRKKDYDKAEGAIKEARSIAPENNSVLGQWGRLLLATKRYNEALIVFSDLVTLVPDSILPHMLLSETYFKLGQPAEAKKQLDIALDKQSDSFGVLVMLARAENQLGQFASAEKHASQIQQIKPDSYIGYELMGDSWVGRKQYADAYGAYEKAWDRTQTSGLVIKLSSVLVQMGKQQQGIDLLRNWLSQKENDVGVRQYLATILQTMGREEEAATTYEKILAHQPDNFAALNNLAVIYSSANSPKALGLAERAYQLNPNNPGVKDTYGWILLQQGKTEKGHALLEQALDKLPNNAEVRYHYAAALIRSGESDQGKEVLRQLLSQEKSFAGRKDAEKLLSE